MHKNSSWAYDVRGYLDSEDPWLLIGQEIRTRYPQIKRSGSKKNALTVDRFDALSQQMTSGVRFADLTPVIQRLQLIKNNKEKEQLIAAGKWADIAF